MTRSALFLHTQHSSSFAQHSVLLLRADIFLPVCMSVLSWPVAVCSQAYSMLHTAADGKLPRVTSLLHVEAFHALCQHPTLVSKVSVCLHSTAPLQNCTAADMTPCDHSHAASVACPAHSTSSSACLISLISVFPVRTCTVCMLLCAGAG